MKLLKSLFILLFFGITQAFAGGGYAHIQIINNNDAYFINLRHGYVKIPARTHWFSINNTLYVTSIKDLTKNKSICEPDGHSFQGTVDEDQILVIRKFGIDSWNCSIINE